MRSYALALLAASGSAAFPTSIKNYHKGTTAAVVTFPTAAADKYVSIKAGQTLQWGYDTAAMYITYDAVGTSAALKNTAADAAAFFVRFNQASGISSILGCEYTATTTVNKSIPILHHASVASQTVVSGNGCDSKEWFASDCIGKVGSVTKNPTAAPAEIADNTTTTLAAETKKGTNYILTTSTSKLSSDRTEITCHIDAKLVHATPNLTNNASFAAGLDTINGGNLQNFGYMKVGAGLKTAYMTAPFFDYTPTAATATATTGSKFSIAAGQTTAGLVVTHTVNAWTATAVVYIEYEWKMTLTTALANNITHSATTCSKIATSVWQCAIMEISGVTLSSSVGVILAFKGYSSTAALSFTTGKPEIVGNLGAVATCIKEYEMTSVAAGTAAATAIPSIPTGFVTGMLQSPQWAWYAKGNQMDATLKIFDGKIQYYSTETNAAAATAVVTAVTAYAPTAWVGACVTTTCLYGAKPLAAVTQTTAAAAATTTTGSLQLASVGAAIALAMAF